MPSIEYDLRFLSAGLVDLEGYLLSKELYWPLGVAPPKGEPPYSHLTLGGLLMSLHNLENESLTPEQQSELDQLKVKLDQTRSRWRSAWDQKVSRSFSERLRLWRDYLEDYRSNPGGNIDRYPYEVRRRAMLQLLQNQSSQISAPDQQLLSGLDNLLNAVFVPGQFVWEEDLHPAYPASTYWYLYGRPKK